MCCCVYTDYLLRIWSLFQCEQTTYLKPAIVPSILNCVWPVQAPPFLPTVHFWPEWLSNFKLWASQASRALQVRATGHNCLWFAVWSECRFIWTQNGWRSLLFFWLCTQLIVCPNGVQLHLWCQEVPSVQEHVGIYWPAQGWVLVETCRTEGRSFLLITSPSGCPHHNLWERYRRDEEKKKNNRWRLKCKWGGRDCRH